MSTAYKLSLFILVLLPVFFGFSSIPAADQILGSWMTKDNKAKVQIYRIKDRFYGKIIAGNALYEADGSTLKKDSKNDDAAKRGRTIKDMVILSGFKYDDGVWSEGSIYDPENGNTYSCKIKLRGSKLEIRGYIGISLLGRTEIWERAKAQ